MVKIISRFFAFCGEENRRRFHQSILLGVLQAVFEALKIPAIACMVRALLRGSVTTQDILLTLGIMLFFHCQFQPGQSQKHDAPDRRRI